MFIVLLDFRPQRGPEPPCGTNFHIMVSPRNVNVIVSLHTGSYAARYRAFARKRRSNTKVLLLLCVLFNLHEQELCKIYRCVLYRLNDSGLIDEETAERLIQEARDLTSNR